MARHHLVTLSLVFLSAPLGLIARSQTPQVQTPKPNLPPPPGFVTNSANPIPPSYYDRYGHIVSASDDPTHPVKLNLPGPGVGELRLPTKDELDLREKLERLSGLTDAEIRAELEKWPPYQKMNLYDQGSMLQKIQQFRDYRSRVALDKSKQLGLTLDPNSEQMRRFTNEFWAKKLAMDRQFIQQFTSAYNQQDEQLKETLFREYSTPSPLPPPSKKATAAPPPKPSAQASTSAPPLPPTGAAKPAANGQE